MYNRGTCDEKALADLGASINLMPYKFFQKLGLGEPKATNMTLQLADRSIRQPKSIIEDVLVKVDKFIFPVYFVMLDIDDQVEILMILGRPFLATSKALIDVKDGQMTLRVGDEEVIFKLKDSMRHSLDFDDTCYSVDVIDDVVSDFIHDTFLKDELEEILGEGSHSVERVMEELHCVNFVAVESTSPPASISKKRSRGKSWWRTSSQREKKATPPSWDPSTSGTTRPRPFGEFELIDSLHPYYSCAL